MIRYKHTNSTRRQTLSNSTSKFNIEDFLYTKKFKCPVCETNFDVNLIKETKIRLLSIEYDLRPVYSPVDPTHYSIISCETCGYTAMKDIFYDISSAQINKILEGITSSFKPITFPKELTIDMVITRYKLALLNARIKEVSEGERAYLCLKILWLYRLKTGDEENEKVFAKLAFNGFDKAYTTEDFPIMGLKESTVIYLLSALSAFLNNKEYALKLLSTLIHDKETPSRIKDMAIDLKFDMMGK